MKLAVGAMLLTGVMACSRNSAAPTPTTATATIMNNAITPNQINVPVGSTVTWMNKDGSAHSIVADGGAFNSGTIAPDGQFSFMFSVAGTFTYHDPANGSLNGSVTVNPSASY